MNTIRDFRFLALCSLIVFACVTFTGCIGGLAQLFYVLKGHEIPAQYADLNSQRVAVIVNTNSSSYGPDSLSETLEKFVTMKLASNVPSIEIVPKVEIDNWTDINGSPKSRLEEVGKAVTADYVLAIGVDEYSIREGSTIYKGKSDVTISVVDTNTGETTYAVGPDHFEYPEHGRPAIQTNDRKFEMFYLAWLSEQISKQFYKHDSTSAVAEDAALIR